MHAASETFDTLRPLLFSIAYRMLGSVGDAEDIVQEAFLRHQRAVDEGRDIESPKAFLSAVVTRLSIDQLLRPGTARELRRRVAPRTAAHRRRRA
jgi:RNA polymerase sigma-70 factor (ECF subfamily)